MCVIILCRHASIKRGCRDGKLVKMIIFMCSVIMRIDVVGGMESYLTWNTMSSLVPFERHSTTDI